MRHWQKFIASLAMLSFFACGPVQSGAGTDSVTEFIVCSASNACKGAGELCSCGTCTRECSAQSDCSEYGPRARCHTAPAVCGEVTIQSEAAGLCTAGCDEDSDCSEMGEYSRCVGSLCVASSQQSLTRAPEPATSVSTSEPPGIPVSSDLSTNAPATSVPPQADPSITCPRDTVRCESQSCEAGYEPLESSPGCCSCAPIDPCGQGQQLVTNPVKLANVLAVRLLGAPAPESLVEAVTALEHSGQLRCLVEDLLKGPESAHGVSAFTRSWLGIQNVTNQRDVDPELGAAMLQSTLLFANDVTQSGGGLIELLTSREVWTSSTLAETYAPPIPETVPGAEANEFRKVILEQENRSGIFTQAAFTIAHGTPRTGITYPVRRGIAIQQALRCLPIPEAPPGVVTALTPPQLEPVPRTTRQRYEEHSSNPVCAGCHALMDPYGFGLENFDSFGRYRVADNNLPIDASIPSPFGPGGKYAGPREFFTDSAADIGVRSCFSAHWLHYLSSGETRANIFEVSTRANEFETAVAREPDASIAGLVGIAASSEAFLLQVDELPLSPDQLNPSPVEPSTDEVAPQPVVPQSVEAGARTGHQTR